MSDKNNEGNNGVFLKLHVAAAKGGLLADMGDSNWRTLCVIASYMDKDGIAFPTQDLIAKHLGVSRQAANKRIRKLLEYRWNGRPVIESKRSRSEGGTWENTVYTILPSSQLGIFDKTVDSLAE